MTNTERACTLFTTMSTTNGNSRMYAHMPDPLSDISLFEGNTEIVKAYRAALVQMFAHELDKAERRKAK